MKNCIVAEGPLKFAESAEYQARCRELQQIVATRYAARFTKAGFFGRLIIRYLRYREFQQELRRITPSPQSCWASHGVTQREDAENAPPNGGPAASVDNSNAPGGPPSVI